MRHLASNHLFIRDVSKKPLRPTFANKYRLRDVYNAITRYSRSDTFRRGSSLSIVFAGMDKSAWFHGSRDHCHNFRSPSRSPTLRVITAVHLPWASKYAESFIITRPYYYASRGRLLLNCSYILYMAYKDARYMRSWMDASSRLARR